MTSKTFTALMIIAFVLRIFMIWDAPLWYDENFTYILARLPFDQMIAATAGDVHPPLWYLIEWIMYHLLPSLPAWAIRLPALTFSLLAIYMFVLVCNSLLIPARVQVAATFLMSILPMQLWYAQEGRMYALLEFLVLAALYAGLQRKLISFAVIATAMLYTQNYSVFYINVISFVLIVLDWSQFKKIIIALAVAVSLYLPWATVVAKQMTEINGRYWIMDAGPGAVLGSVYKQFFASAMLAPGLIPSYVIVFAVLIIGAYSMVITHSQKQLCGIWWVVLMMAFAPLAIAWIVSVLWQPVLLFRPLIGISPFLYLVAAWPLAEVKPFLAMPSGKLYAACFIIPLLGMGTIGYFQNIAAMKGEGAVSPMLDTLDYVRAHWQDGDVIYFTDDGPMTNIMPYAADLPYYKMPACDERVGYAPVLGSLSDSTRLAMGVKIVDLEDVPHKRAWIFAPRSPLHPTCYDMQIAEIAPEGKQIITVDDNEYISSGVWLREATQ
jgi:uncharacterized membrane protein